MKWYTQCCVFVEAASLRLLRCVTSIVWLLEQCWGNLAWPPSPSDCFAAGCRSRWVSEQSSPWPKGCHNDTQLLVMPRRRFVFRRSSCCQANRRAVRCIAGHKRANPYRRKKPHYLSLSKKTKTRRFLGWLTSHLLFFLGAFVEYSNTLVQYMFDEQITVLLIHGADSYRPLHTSMPCHILAYMQLYKGHAFIVVLLLLHDHESVGEQYSQKSNEVFGNSNMH